MNLIDLDKALAEAYDECRMSDDWKVSHEMMNVFKYQPIIKAIPIEYIQKWNNNYIADTMRNGRTIINQMLADWEKENVDNQTDQ